MSAPAAAKRPERGSRLKDFRLRWRLMSAYERFEQVVVLALGLIIAAIDWMALLQPYRRVVPLLIDSAIDPPDHDGFQSLFGANFTALIALPAFSRKFVSSVRQPRPHRPSPR